MIQQFYLWLFIWRKKTLTREDTYTPIFIAALFTIAKIWKQPKCPSMDEWTKKLWYIYNGILFSHKKEQKFAFWDNTNVPKGYYDK